MPEIRVELGNIANEIVVDLTKKKPIDVLHVEDDSAFSKVAKRCLETQGQFQVDTARSVDEALQKMKTKTYDVVICDYIMPEKIGLAFLEELRSEGNSMPFIMLTGKGREEVAVKSFNLGADRFFEKTGPPEAMYSELAHSIRQVMEGRRVEDALKASEDYLKSIMSSIFAGVIVVDAETHKIVDANSQALDAIGAPTGDVIGKACHKFVCLGKAAKCPITDLGQTEDRSEHLLKRANGEKIPILKSAVMMTWKGHKYVVESFVDITERKRTEQALRESQEKFESLFRFNPEAAVHLDLSFRILNANPRFTRLFGYCLDEIKGKHINDVIVPKDKMEEALAIDERARKGEIHHEDTVRERKDGSLIHVALSAAPLIVGNQVVGNIGVYKDISQLKRTEEELRQASENLVKMNEKLRVIGGLTRHDVRNKLSAITGNVYLVRKKSAGNDRIMEYLNDVESAVAQIVRIFDFGKAYEMLGVEELWCTDVEKMVDEAVSLISDLEGVRVINSCHGLTVLADSLLRQLFYNLVDNSLKYGEKTKTITIRYEETDKDNLKLIYEDDGVGIAESEKNMLFREGYGKGTGYGLYLIRKMCEAYGWTIQETGKENEGARFTMNIPRIGEKKEVCYSIS